MAIPGGFYSNPNQPVQPAINVLQAPRYSQDAQGRVVPTGQFDPLHNKITASTANFPTMQQLLQRFGQYTVRIAYDNVGRAQQVLEWQPFGWVYDAFGLYNPNPAPTNQSGFNTMA